MRNADSEKFKDLLKVTDSFVSNIGFSDHCLVMYQLVNLQMWTPFQLKVVNWRGFRWRVSSRTCLNQHYVMTSWTISASVNKPFDRYLYEMSTLLDFHASPCRKRRKKHMLTPWFDDECTAFKRSNHWLEKKYRRTRQDDDRKKWMASLKKQVVYFCKKEQLGKGHVALLGLLDLSAAFDTIDHDVLLKQLEVSFGVCGTPLKCMKLYVAGCTQTVFLQKTRLKYLGHRITSFHCPLTDLDFIM